MAGTEPPPLLCDEMLVGIGRWLRVARYDTALANNGDSDRDLVERAVAEGRLLLTRDRKLIERRKAQPIAVLVDADGLEGQARELSRRLGIDWLRRPFSRCIECNVALRPARDEEIASVPADVRQAGLPILSCPRCGRVYWEGSHVLRMRDQLERFAQLTQNAAD